MASLSFALVKPPHSSSWNSHRGFLQPLSWPSLRHTRFKTQELPLSLRALARQEEEEQEQEQEREAGEYKQEQERLISNLSVEEIEQKLGKRRRSKKERGDKDERGRLQSEPRAPKKDWEAMSLSEKALELYVGEKGALYWLNKLAYASIFIIIGGWIIFRFVGPALNLYQLESPLLPPDQVLRGSSP